MSSHMIRGRQLSRDTEHRKAMRRNLGVTHGLIVAEAVMMGLAPQLGREEAHHVVKHACDAALSERIDLDDALAREKSVTDKLGQRIIEVYPLR